ncbi:hypothetical protein KBD71_03890 [Candidatus Woesebacteria bacterium]|nr:hypothetical protein [Candidatus Woesebacteria bacterium]
MNRFEQFVDVFGRRRTEKKPNISSSDISDEDFFAVLNSTSYVVNSAQIQTGIGLPAEQVVSERFMTAVPQDVLTVSSGLISSVGSLASMFAHGGALCAHCVASVGSNIGGFSSLGLPGIGGGHWHGDTWHATNHEEDEKEKIHRSPTSESSRNKPQKTHLPNKRDSAGKRWQFSGETVTISDFVSSWFYLSS